MPRSANQKLKLLCLCRILWERTDEDHPLTVPELIQALEAWDIKAERKSIYDDMEALRTLGMDVQSRKGKSPGWFLGERTFQLAELKLLVDAVQSSKFITQRKSSELIRKLESQASVHQARQLQRQVYVDRRVKSMNESVYYTIDKLHTAIANRKAVTFKYFEYNVKKEKVFRREGKRYTVSPLGLIWDNENYYLAGYDHRSCEMRHYRVDKMAELAVTCLPLEGADGGFDIASYAQKHFGMFSGREGQVTLRCRNSLVGVVLDRFGRDAILVPDGEEHFTVTVPAVVSPQFLGWVFGLGDGVQILRPDWAAEELKRQLAAVAALYFVDSTAFEGLLPSVMSALSLFERFYTFVNGVFDLTAVFYYLTVAALFLFLSVQSLEKRRYN
jgi:predicted DNA-binding transcriptional regulator YafY